MTFIFLSLILSPPLIVLVIILNVIDQVNSEGKIYKTKEKAQKELLISIMKCPLAIVYYIFIILILLLRNSHFYNATY